MARPAKAGVSGQRRFGDAAAPGGQPAPQPRIREWELSCEREIFTWAARQVHSHRQPSTWQAFWQTAIEGKPARAVAVDLGITVAAVYLARSRIMARLRQHIQDMQGEGTEPGLGSDSS